jgi:hemoglobin
MTVRMIAGCLVALTPVVGVGGCASMGGGSGLLDQLGGSSTLKALSDAFVNNAASDPRSSKLLSGANLGTLKSKVSDQFCAALGGGCTAPLSSAQVTEAAKKVDAPTSSGLIDSLVKALDSVKAAPAVKEGVTKLLGPQLGGIVAGLL